MSNHEPSDRGPGYIVHKDEPKVNGSNGKTTQTHANGEADHRAPNEYGHNSPHSWDDPDTSILDDRRGDLPDFPITALSVRWRDWIERAAHGAGVTVAHIAVPLLGVASSLIGASRMVRASRSWCEPVTLWTCVVASSGDRKTSGINVTLRALNLIEKANSAETKAARLAHDTRMQKSKEVHKKWKAECQAALDAQQEPPLMPVDAIDPGNFVCPRLYATDATIESLAALLSARPRGMTLIRDELAGLFSNMNRYSAGSDRPFWLEAWNGGRHVVTRVSRSIAVDHLLVGVVGGFQPDKLARAFAGDEDGMYARFLFGWPSPPAYRPLTNEVAEVEPHFQSALAALARLPAEDPDGVFVPRYIELSEGALQKFEQFRIYIDETKGGLDGRERQWSVKGETQVLRLAGTLAYLDWAISLGTPVSEGIEGITGALEPESIAEQFMVSAIRIWSDFFWPHSRAALRQIGLSERHSNARRVLRWIKAQAKTEISREETRREALGKTLDADQTQSLLEQLTKAGWLRPTTTPTGGRRRQRWQVNPLLLLGAERAARSES